MANVPSEESSTQSVLLELADLDLADLPMLDRPVLVGALSRIRHEVENPDEAVAGFQSSI